MSIHSNTTLGEGPTIVRRYLLSEDSGFTIPPGASVLYSEVVVNDNDQEILQLWLAVPDLAFGSQHGEAPQTTGQTIHTNTVVHEGNYEDNPQVPREYIDDDEDEFDEEEFYLD